MEIEFDVSIPNYWCVAEVIYPILEAINIPDDFVSDIGVGYSWSFFWKNENLDKDYKERIRGMYSCFEVWFYPHETLQVFSTWFESYLNYKIKQATEPHKTYDPVLPEGGLKKDSIFANKRICFTGFYPQDKKKIQEITDTLSIVWAPGVSKKIDYLVTGPNKGPSKIQKATDLGIPIVSAEIFASEVIE